MWKEDFVFFFDPSNEKRKVDGRCLSINSDRDNFGFDSLQFRSIDIGTIQMVSNTRCSFIMFNDPSGGITNNNMQISLISIFMDTTKFNGTGE